MRDRLDIEAEANQDISGNQRSKLQLEVLLDIRDLLSEMNQRDENGYYRNIDAESNVLTAIQSLNKG